MHTGHASWDVHDNEQKIGSFSINDVTLINVYCTAFLNTV